MKFISNHHSRFVLLVGFLALALIFSTLVLGRVNNNDTDTSVETISATPEIRRPSGAKKNCLTPDVQTNIVPKAEAYIINQVGEEYFEENYVFKGCTGTSYSSSGTTYTLSYEYLPATEAAGEPVTVSVSASAYEPARSNYCFANAETEPIISKDQAIQIAEAQGYNMRSETAVSFGLGAVDQCWAWEISTSVEGIDSYCFYEDFIQIDAHSGVPGELHTGAMTACI